MARWEPSLADRISWRPEVKRTLGSTWSCSWVHPKVFLRWSIRADRYQECTNYRKCHNKILDSTPDRQIVGSQTERVLTHRM